MGMNEKTQTVELTDAELKIVHSALRSYLQDFGHDEADILHAVKELLEKLPSGEHYFK
jgi:hypothetical protein